jgi:hypothetical protein
MADPWVPEPGSVVRYGYDARDGTLRHGGDAIVDHLEGGRLMLTAWRSRDARGWVSGIEGWIGGAYEPHPEAERVWAEYVAWRLANHG